MQALINRPLIHAKLNSNYNYHGPTYLHRSSNFAPNYASCHLSNCFRPIRVSKFGGFVNSLNRREQVITQIRAQENPNSPASDSWFSGLWRKWKWKPLIENYCEICLLIFQLRLILLVIRFLKLDFPIAGFEPRPQTINVAYSDFLSNISNDQVSKVVVDGEDMLFKLRSDEKTEVSSSIQGFKTTLLLSCLLPTKRVVYSTIRPAAVPVPHKKMLDNGVNFGSSGKRSGGFLISAMKTLFYFIVVYGAIALLIQECIPQEHREQFMRILARLDSDESKSSDDKGKSKSSNGTKYPETGRTVTFADVAGVDEAKEELQEIVEFLKNPDKYIRVGARSPRGILLVGSPGTGKTLLAKAVAGEAGVPFISRSGSEFVELYVGTGASRVRKLFAEARKVAPSIVFIDEIDAVAKKRNGRRTNSENDQTLNQLLTEMDGFDSSSTVIVLGATNRIDVLDPAVRRPGRFDRVVQVETPNNLGRLAVLKVHISKQNIPLTEDVDLSEIATMTAGYTGADLANLVNEAALLAGRQNKVSVEKIDFVRAFERSIMGLEKKTAKLKGNDKAVVARHEAGHAVVGTAVANLLSGQPRVKKLSILPRSGGTLGFTYTPPTNEDSCLTFVDELRGRLVTLLGGRAAEEFAYGWRVSTGAHDDIRRATGMAYKAVAEYGLSQTIGPMSVARLSARDQGYVVDLVQREVKSLLQSALDVALCVVRANATVLEGLGALLEENEKVEGEELQAWLKLVVAPTELSLFVQGKEEPVLPPKPDPEKELQHSI